MADNNKLELVVEVDVNKANASIKSINTGLSSMEQAAGKAARGASAGIDGLTVSMVKGSAAGNLLADSIKKALDWAKEWTLGAAQHAAHTDKMTLSMAALAKAHGVSAEASNRAVEAVKKVGFGTQDAIHAVDRLMVADMNLSKAEGLAKVAKDAAAIENITPGEALEKLLMAIESGASRGLRTMGIFVDLNKEVDRQEKLTGRTLDENEVRQLRYNAVMREAAKIQGAAAAATGSAEAQSAALAREVNELKEAVGGRAQPASRSTTEGAEPGHCGPRAGPWVGAPLRPRHAVRVQRLRAPTGRVSDHHQHESAGAALGKRSLRALHADAQRGGDRLPRVCHVD